MKVFTLPGHHTPKKSPEMLTLLLSSVVEAEAHAQDEEEVLLVEGAEAEPEVVPHKGPGHSILKRTQGGPPPDTQIYPHSTRARSTGLGASHVTNVLNHRHVLGRISPRQNATTSPPHHPTTKDFSPYL